MISLGPVYSSLALTLSSIVVYIWMIEAWWSEAFGSLAVTFTKSFLALLLKVIKRVLGFRYWKKNKQARIKRQTNLLNIVLIFPGLFLVIFENIDTITCSKRFKHSLSRFRSAGSKLTWPTYSWLTSTKQYFINLGPVLKVVLLPC